MCLSKPKIPTPTAVVERQAYKNAPSRASLSTGDSETRRRVIAGVATSANGVANPASTTKRVRTGGDQPLGSVLSGAPSSGTIIPDVISSSLGATPNPQTRSRTNTAAAVAGLITRRMPQAN